MSLIIDGHNLIGVMPDISLADPDDERRLVERLRAYRARSGSRPLIVFFDSGHFPGKLPDLSSPRVQVRFTAPGQTADDAIVAFLQGHSQPEQYTVVTNDQDLANRVRAVGARRILASDFAARLALRPPLPSSEPGRPAFDPHDPAFADIYAGFVQADKARARFGGSRQADTAFWIEKLYGDDLDEVQRAARWLGQHGGSYALAPLRDALTHGDARVRAAALLALGDLGDQTVLPDLCARLANDTNSMVREAAAQSLGRIGDRTIEPALEAAARTDAKGKVRKAAQAALAQVRARRKARP